MFDIDRIGFNPTYQRMFEKSRYTKIKKLLIEYGMYWPSSVITLNEQYEVIDGQHRVKAAKDLGYKELPCCIVTFPTLQHEARFFSDYNNYNPTLKAIDFWNARFLAGHPVAKIIYDLESNPSSSFYNKIAIKGKETKASKWSIVMAISAISISCCLSNTHWSINHDQIITNAVVKTDYNYIMAYTNDMVRWFESCFGTKLNGSLAYQSRIFRPILLLYQVLLNNGVANKKDTINRMKTYFFSSELIKIPSTGILQLLIAHYNKNKSDKNRINIK